MKATLIYNPQAGGGPLKSLHNAIRALEEGGWSLAVRETGGQGGATALAEEAVLGGAQAVVVAGGDGTINEAIQALAGTDVALGYLPAGTVNVWAREIGLPLDVAGAARALLTGRVARVDLGVANDRYFLLMAGIGFDGEVLRRARSLERHKQRLGVLPYVMTGISTIPLYRGRDFELRYDGLIRRTQALMLVVSNTRLYGGRFQMTPEAVANDGLLDVCIVKGRGPLALARQSIPMLLSRSSLRSKVELFRVRELSLRSDVPVAYQVDGELAGATPIHFRIEPQSLSAIVPRDLASDLIA